MQDYWTRRNHKIWGNDTTVIRGIWLSINSRKSKETTMHEDSVGGYAVPVNPMDFLQCDSC